MRKLLGLGALALLCAVLVAGAQAGKQATVVNLTFATYVWQPTTVAAMKAIVDALEQEPSRHPGLDRPGRRQLGPRQAADDVRRRHRGGHHPRRGRRHRRLHAAGLPGEPDAADPEGAEGLDPEVALGDGQLRRQDHRRPVAAPDLQRLREHGHPQGGGHQGADGRRTRGRGPVPRRREEADERRATTASAGASARRPPSIQTMSLNWGGQLNYLENGKWVVQGRPDEQNVVTKMHDMIYVDKSVDPAATGLSGCAVLPAFFGGKCAMTVQGNFTAQGMIEQSPKGFNWAMFPLLKGTDAGAGGEPADALDLAAEQAQGGGDVVHRLRAEHAEHGEARAGRLADPVEPGRAASWRASRRSTTAAGGSRSRRSSTSARGTGSRWPRTRAGRRRSRSRRSSSTCADQITLHELDKQLSDGWTRVAGIGTASPSRPASAAGRLGP